MKKLSLLLFCTFGIILSIQGQKLSKKEKLKEKILKSDEWQQMSTAYLAHYTHKRNRIYRCQTKTTKSNFSSYQYVLNELQDNLAEKQKATYKAFPKLHKLYGFEEFVNTFLIPLREQHKAKYSNIRLVSK